MVNKIPPYLQEALIFSLLISENWVLYRYMHIQDQAPRLKDPTVL